MKLGLSVWLVIGAMLAGCGGSADSAGIGDYMDDDLPMGQCGNTGCADSGSGGVPVGFPCGASLECSGDAVCLAPYEGGEVGEFVCTAMCVPNSDESAWCLDSSACCDATATCNARGLCIPGEGGDDSTGGGVGTTTGGTAGDAGTGATTGGVETGGTADSGGTGSSTGGGSGTGG